MSRKAPRTKPQPSYEDQWRSGHSRWGLQRFRLGRDHKIHFAGQHPDETVIRVVRKHWLFLVFPALPLIGSILAFFVVFWASTAFPSLGVISPFLYFAAILLFIGTLGWFVWKDFIAWWLENYIITNERIINSRGLLQPTRQETAIEKVNQVGIDFYAARGFVLGYGNVHVYLTGGDLVMRDVPNPRKVRDALLGISEEVKAKKPPKPKPPVPEDSDIKAVLGELSKGKEVPKLPDADEHYPPPRNPDALHGPRRTFGGPLRLRCEVHYTSGETTVMYIQRSRFILYRNLAPPVLLLLAVLPAAIYIPTRNILPPSFITMWWTITTLVLLGLILAIGIAYIAWVDDLYILTNKRVIDIERRLIFFFEMRMEAEYKNFRDIKVLVPNVFYRMLDIGNIYIETPGKSPDITLESVDHPFFLMDKINDIRTIKEKADAIKKENETKEELNNWFSNVVTTLERKTQFKGAPNVQRLEFLEAMELASNLGLNIVLLGEDVNPDVPPGYVIQQSPPPGTAMTPGAELQVLLSRGPSPFDGYE